MNYFVNEYRNTDEVIAECITAQIRKRSVVLYIAIGYFILCALYFLSMHIYFVGSILYGWSYQELVTIILPPLLIWVCIRRKNRAIRTHQERIKVVYQDEAPVYRIEISEDIHATGPKNERTISFSDVMKLIETKNLMILMIRGNLTITLDKRGFIQGDADACRQYLKEKMVPHGWMR